MIPRQEPVYQGKPLSAWLVGYDDGVWGSTQRKKADEAVLHLGTNAIPTLLRLLQADDSTFKMRLVRCAEQLRFFKIDYKPAHVRRREAFSGLNVLGAEAKSAVPVLVDLYESPNDADRNAIAIALAGIGPEAKPAVPSLLRALDDPDLNVRRTAAAALGRIGAEPEAVVPKLINCLSNQDTYFKQDLCYALEGFGPEAKSAVPALLELLEHPNQSVRKDAARALKQINPEAIAQDETK
jgi:HEAT repeat protein